MKIKRNNKFKYTITNDGENVLVHLDNYNDVFIHTELIEETKFGRIVNKHYRAIVNSNAIEYFNDIDNIIDTYAILKKVQAEINSNNYTSENYSCYNFLTDISYKTDYNYKLKI